jgi:succinyl-diaminopimelate desuccinylase
MELDLRELLTDLVSIPSMNPSVKGSDNRSSELKVGKYVERLLKENNIDVRVQQVEGERCNIIGHVPRGSLADDKVLLFVAHMDTFPPSDFTVGECAPKIDGDILTGHGSADNKGSLAAMLHAVLSASTSEKRRETYIVATVDEEFQMKGAKKLAEAGIKADLAIVGEPTTLIPIIAQKGIVRSSMRVSGDVSHAAYPRGKNSLTEAARVLLAIEAFNQRLKSREFRFRNVALDKPSVMPTSIVGQGDMNSSPVETVIRFDARFLPGETAEGFLEELKSFIFGETEITVAIDEPSFVSPSSNCSDTNPVLLQLCDVIKSFTGVCEPDCFSYGSEAGVLARSGIPSLVLGPGDPKYSHKKGECISITELTRAAAIYHGLIVGSK